MGGESIGEIWNLWTERRKGGGGPANSDAAANLVRLGNLENLDAVEFVGRVVRLDDLDHLSCEPGAKWQES